MDAVNQRSGFIAIHSPRGITSEPWQTRTHKRRKSSADTVNAQLHTQL